MYSISHAVSFSNRIDWVIDNGILVTAFMLPISLNAASVALGMTALFWVGKMIAQGQIGIRQSPFDFRIMAFVLWSGLSMLYSPDREGSFYNYYHLMGRYILLYYLVISNVNSLSQVRRLIWAVLLSAAVVSVYGFYQYFFSGLDVTATGWIDGEQFPDIKVRIFSTLQNPNLLAGFLVTVMAVASGIGLYTPGRRRRLLLFGLAGVLGVCLLLTYSRGAWLSALAVLGVCGMIYNRRLLWLVLFLPVLALLAHDAVSERLLSIMNPVDTSCSLRLAVWESTVAMIMDHPLTGVGWGAYQLVYPSYDFFVLNQATTIYHAHNMYLHLAAETGLPGLAAFLSIMVGHIRLALSSFRQARDKRTRGMMLGILAAFAGIAVSGMTDYVMYNVQIAMLFWLLNAVVISAQPGNRAGA